jgi:hypothetical protein
MRKIFISFLLVFGYIISTQSQVEEKIEPPYIKTIQFRGSTSQSQLPILQLGESIQLSFDALNGDEADFYYKIDHFNFDWTPSDLSKGEYLDGYDDVRIYNYDNSFNTLQIYSNYRLSIPNNETRRIKKSGNYMLSIFDDDSNLIFSRKFMLVEHLTNVSVEIKRSRDFKYIGQKQVVQFSINSPNLLITNPKQTVKTLVLQNSNLKTAITNLVPQYTIGTELIYRYDDEASFWGGNEFQNFDNKAIRGATSSIRFVDLTDVYENYLYTDISRKDRPYTYNPDINGNFVVRAQYVENQNIEADYARIFFNLQFFEDIGDKEIHLYGNFNNWTIDESTYMVYDEESDTYSNYRLFKQGFYNYKYVLVNRDGSIDEGAICGNFWQTENDYTVIVYFRDLGARYDRIVGLGRANSTNITNN